MPTDEQLKKREAAKEVIDLLEEVAILLVSGPSQASSRPDFSFIDTTIGCRPEPGTALAVRQPHRKRGASRSAGGKFMVDDILLLSGDVIWHSAACKWC